MTNSDKFSASARQKYVEKACRAKNCFEGVADVLHYNSSQGNEFRLYCRTKSDMTPKMLKWVFKLAERNVSPFYKQLAMGWQPKVKQNDLIKNWARYLVATNTNGDPVAYAMFRFDMDFGQSVLYCYEMQIEPSEQRQGLGRHMMNALEACARHWQMEKVVLTCLKNNLSGMSFFKTIGYTLDDSSPDVLEQAEYEILSKCVAD